MKSNHNSGVGYANQNVIYILFIIADMFLLNHLKTVPTPHLLASVWSLHVIQMPCGKTHSVHAFSILWSNSSPKL